MKNIKLWIGLFLLAVLFLSGYLLGSRQSKEITKVTTDTITKVTHDTVKITDTKVVYRKTIDTLHFHKTDSVFIVLPKEQVVYKGKDYKAWVSGYKPKLDSINIFKEKEVKYIIKEIKSFRKPKRWGVGVQIGYGAVIKNKTIDFQPYIGIGINYNIIKF